ncbi:bactofilin family protein [Nitrospina watsonii]|uniref:Polymer-forming cytoskeletal protein n=1 Tax=Nitrospina watsonii TaxID=1323948 RepID=A0ABN8W630_9BACT|nr:polymer-forming cytoskeletal protein [Nitrospina watsonii]CAI2719721.1 conserved protein of unknown function [Nitrospina watsonii]
MAKPVETSKDIKAYMGEETHFKGTLSFTGTVRMDGQLEGEVQTQDTLIVGEKGIVKADISAGTVICKGKIYGTIKATQRVEIHANSEMVGNIDTPSVFIEVGATFDGNCKMGASEKKIVPLVKDESGEKTGTDHKN